MAKGGQRRPRIRIEVPEGVVLIKKYGNRRLYDTSRSKYVTLEELAETVAAGTEIMVVDLQSGQDITKRILTQIILHEEEQRHLNLLPLSFLRRLIQYRDESLKEFFQKYLSMSLDIFMTAQKEMDRKMKSFDPTGTIPSETLRSFFPWMDFMNITRQEGGAAAGAERQVIVEDDWVEPEEEWEEEPPKEVAPEEAWEEEPEPDPSDQLEQLKAKLAELESMISGVARSSTKAAGRSAATAGEAAQSCKASKPTKASASQKKASAPQKRVAKPAKPGARKKRTTKKS